MATPMAIEHKAVRGAMRPGSGWKPTCSHRTARGNDRVSVPRSTLKPDCTGACPPTVAANSASTADIPAAPRAGTVATHNAAPKANKANAVQGCIAIKPGSIAFKATTLTHQPTNAADLMAAPASATRTRVAAFSSWTVGLIWTPSPPLPRLQAIRAKA